MVSKHDLMRAAGAVANGIGLTALAASRFGGRGAIFTLHSVRADNDFLPRENIHTSARFLDGMLSRYRQRRIPIVTLTEALERLKSKSAEQFVSFTFDDGYRDNLTVALPIFRKHDAPFTIYMSTAHLQRNTEYWWGQVRHLVMDNAELSGDYLPAPLSLATAEDKIKAFRQIRRDIDSGSLGPQQRDVLFDRYHIPLAEALDRDVMTAEELKAAAEKEPLIEIGGHATSHRRLKQLSESDAYDDIAGNKTYLENLLGREMRHFAYPYGDEESCGERDFGLARKAGYATAATMRIDTLSDADADNPWALPRLRFMGPCESYGFMECQRTGLVGAIASRFGKAA